MSNPNEECFEPKQKEPETTENRDSEETEETGPAGVAGEQSTDEALPPSTSSDTNCPSIERRQSPDEDNDEEASLIVDDAASTGSASGETNGNQGPGPANPIAQSSSCSCNVKHPCCQSSSAAACSGGVTTPLVQNAAPASGSASGSGQGNNDLPAPSNSFAPANASSNNRLGQSSSAAARSRNVTTPNFLHPSAAAGIGQRNNRRRAPPVLRAPQAFNNPPPPNVNAAAVGQQNLVGQQNPTVAGPAATTWRTSIRRAVVQLVELDYKFFESWPYWQRVCVALGAVVIIILLIFLFNVGLCYVTDESICFIGCLRRFHKSDPGADLD